jgi:RNA-directed DNA polymerase
MAHHPNPVSCAARREVAGEVLTGETCGPAIEPRNHDFGMPTPLCEAEGHRAHDNKCKPCSHPARSKTLSTLWRHDLRQEPYAVMLHVRICAGGIG